MLLFNKVPNSPLLPLFIWLYVNTSIEDYVVYSKEIQTAIKIASLFHFPSHNYYLLSSTFYYCLSSCPTFNWTCTGFCSSSMLFSLSFFLPLLYPNYILYTLPVLFLQLPFLPFPSLYCGINILFPLTVLSTKLLLLLSILLCMMYWMLLPLFCSFF